MTHQERARRLFQHLLDLRLSDFHFDTVDYDNHTAVYVDLINEAGVDCSSAMWLSVEKSIAINVWGSSLPVRVFSYDTSDEEITEALLREVRSSRRFGPGGRSSPSSF